MPLLGPDSLIPRPHDPRLGPDLVVRSLAPVLLPERRRRIERVLHRRVLSVTVVLENLHDPHNGAAAMRTCEAMGLHHIHVVEGREPFSFSRKVSVSAHKWLAVYLHPSIEACLGYLAGAGFSCWAAMPPPLHARAADRIEVSVERPVALVFGNEHEGLTPRALALCPKRFSIPMHGFSESLNLSVSVSLAAREVVARRRAALGRLGDLSPRALAQLRAFYYAVSARHAAAVVSRALNAQTETAEIKG